MLISNNHNALSTWNIFILAKITTIGTMHDYWVIFDKFKGDNTPLWAPATAYLLRKQLQPTSWRVMLSQRQPYNTTTVGLTSYNNIKQSVNISLKYSSNYSHRFLCEMTILLFFKWGKNLQDSNDIYSPCLRRDSGPKPFKYSKQQNTSNTVLFSRNIWPGTQIEFHIFPPGVMAHCSNNNAQFSA
jgi:hypothetical protein